jgi:hypothetical protein
MKAYTNVSRKNVEEDQVAICPNFGCDFMTRVKPLKFRFLGFGKYPKCKKHHIPLVYVDERIGDFVDAALACLFDKAGLPPSELLEDLKSKFPDEITSFVEGWLYCITVGRGAPIVSRYMDTISNAYLKQLTKKQIKSLKKGDDSKPNLVNKAIKDGMDEITIQYTKILKHLRAHSEILMDHQKLESLSKDLRNYLNDWHKIVLKLNEIMNFPENKRQMALKEIKGKYDQILNVSTCRCLLGLNLESKELKKAKITAFDRFSAYYEFLNEGITVKFTKSDILNIVKIENTHYEIDIKTIDLSSRSVDLINNSEKLKQKKSDFPKDHIKKDSMAFFIKIHNFKQEIWKYLKKLMNLIECTTKQKEIINLKSNKILDDFILRVERKIINANKDLNLNLTVAAILYTAIISCRDVPRFSLVRISEIARVNSNSLGTYYRKFFSRFYPKAEFSLSEFRIGRISNYISVSFFEKLKDDINIKTSVLVSSLMENVMRNANIPSELTQKDINTLNEIIISYQKKFTKYFSDLVEIVRNLIISVRSHKKIDALFFLNPFVEYLRKKNIDLLQNSRFYHSIDRIFNFLKEKYPDFFPIQYKERDSLTKKEKEKRYREDRRIVASKLKFYLLKSIYNGKYYEDGVIKCPECVKEGYNYNINSLRLKAIVCHHNSAKKENLFKSDNLYLLFNQNRGNPNVLEELVKILESEEIVILCRNHHKRLHFNDEFDYIVNMKGLFSLPAELIHLIVKISINSFRLTKNLSTNEKASKKKNILRKIKKRYIIEKFYGEFCHVCEEFSIRKDLMAFDFHHLSNDFEKIKAHELYDTLHCSKIATILIQEKGGYICSNCHSVIGAELIHLISDIFDDENIVKRIQQDINFSHSKFTSMNNISHTSIKSPLKKSLDINETFERYLNAIFILLNSKKVVTISDLTSFTGISSGPIHKFLNKESSILKQSIKIKNDGVPKPIIITLTEKGREFISLIYHIKDYYNSL